MTYSRLKKTTAIEKKMQLLRGQLYGRQDVKPQEATIQTPVPQFAKYQTTTSVVNIQETSFLKQDLLKILFLAATAIGIQIMLYLSLNLNILKF